MITVDARGIEEVQRRLESLAREQIPYATMLAINETAFAVRGAVQDEMKRVFDRPKPWTINQVRVRKATKTKLVAVVGAEIFQDHHFGKWPQCYPPQKEYQDEEYQCQAKNPDMIFDVEWNGSYWKCKADGYGRMRRRGENRGYGSGSIFVLKFDGVELVNPT